MLDFSIEKMKQFCHMWNVGRKKDEERDHRKEGIREGNGQWGRKGNEYDQSVLHACTKCHMNPIILCNYHELIKNNILARHSGSCL
jgi:hypothetical protein